MKSISLLSLVALLFTAACTTSKPSGDEKAAYSIPDSPSTVVVTELAAKVLPADLNHWTIAGNDTWQHDPQKFVFIYARGGEGASLYTGDFTYGPNDKTGINTITSPTQGRLLGTRHFDGHECEGADFVNVELDSGKGTGWMYANEIMVVEELVDAGIRFENRTLGYGVMRPLLRKDSNGQCHQEVAMFLYDQKYIFFIDPDEYDDRLGLDSTRYLCVSDHPEAGPMLKGEQGQILLTWSDALETANAEVVFSDGHFKLTHFRAVATDGMSEDEDGSGPGL